MKSLYIDCSMGAAGDMLTAALLELFPDKEKIVDELNAIGVPGVRFEMEKSVKCGIAGTHMRVLVDGEEEVSEDVHSHEDHDHDHSHSHHHTSMHDIEHIVNDHLKVSAGVKKDIIAVYNIIAEAESLAHDCPVTEIHFHEVGNKDAIADISAVCYLIDFLLKIS